LPVTHQENILLADGADEFAEGVISLLRDRGRRRALGRAARQLVEQQYSWTAASRHVEAILTTLVRRREMQPAQLNAETLSASRC
jgi:glycosyltransferase involved in cell wall biosynthesis